MVSILRRTTALVALAVGIGVAAGAAPAVAATTHHTAAVHATHSAEHPGRSTSTTFVQPNDWWF